MFQHFNFEIKVTHWYKNIPFSHQKLLDTAEIFFQHDLSQFCLEIYEGLLQFVSLIPSSV